MNEVGPLDPATPPASPEAGVHALREISADKKDRIEKALGGPMLRPAMRPPQRPEPPARPPQGVRAERALATQLPGRSRNGIIDAPDPDTKKVKDDVQAIRGLFAAIAGAITAAEVKAPAILQRLATPEASEIAGRLEDFDVSAAQAFLTGASDLLDSVKPKEEA